MKESTLCAALSVALLIAGHAVADNSTATTPSTGSTPTTPATKKLKTFKGDVSAVLEKEKIVLVKGAVFKKTFNASANCTLSFENKPRGSWADLRPGQKVEVSYEDADGILVAQSIAQYDPDFTGYITAIDTAKRSVTVKHGRFSRNFLIPESCRVIVRGADSGSLNALKIGHTIVVDYEKRGEALLAQRIQQNSPSFVGSITAIDTGLKTVKARNLLDERRFSLGDDCRIVVNGKTDGELSDLRIGERVTFTYEDVNGVLVANRIGRETTSPESQNAQAPKTGDR
jgi:Cu/Ag efflux protein CusF